MVHWSSVCAPTRLTPSLENVERPYLGIASGLLAGGSLCILGVPLVFRGQSSEHELKTAPYVGCSRMSPKNQYSLDGISVVASATGEPLHTEKSRLDPYHFGDTKVKIEITLDQDPPKLVEVRDVQGNAVRIMVEYPSLPPKCLNCGKYGHLINRCTKPLIKKKKALIPNQTQERMASTSTKISLNSSSEDAIQAGSGSLPEKSDLSESKERKKKSKRRGRSRSRAQSTPPLFEIEQTQDIQEGSKKKGDISPESQSLSLAMSSTKEIDAVPPEDTDAVGLEEDLQQGKAEEKVSEPDSPPGGDPEEDERMWFKHPKAVRKAIRQELWRSSLMEQPHKEASSVRTWGSSSGRKIPL
ncbi:unnamed protein product [Brassica napus]|uniref:(rape) hypothetical protein n=1 Tax=Brassica napus TaxID=3708 RepID=A0A816TFB0_BRANA|nr:unnamed protein product [Brassica napus]